MDPTATADALITVFILCMVGLGACAVAAIMERFDT